MRTLSDTISRLRTLREARGFTPPSNVHGRLVDLEGFGSNPGALAAKAYVPPALPKKAPLVVVLHGCTQSAEGYDHASGWSALADQEGFAVLYPEQQRANNPNLCFNWFVPGDIRRGEGEVLSIRQMIASLVTRYDLDPSRIFIAGLSAGGAMASAMLATYPEVFAGGAIIAGLAYGCANTVPEAFDRMRGSGGPSERELQALLRKASGHTGPWPTISVWQGSADHTVAPANAEAIVGQWRAVHAIDRNPSGITMVNGFPRRVWCDATGREVVEEYTITGMGHGTPLRTRGAGSFENSAPYMLDVGISSTLQIASFWGLTVADKAEQAERRDLPTTVKDTGQAASKPSDQPVVGVRKIIEDALRSAGLMR